MARRVRIRGVLAALPSVPAAWLGALAVETSLAAVGLERTLAWIDRVPPRRVRRRPVPVSTHVADTKRVVGIAYRLHVFRGLCLSRSLVEYLVHRRTGTPVRFVVGVRHTSGRNRIEGHAWVEARDARRTEPFEELLVATAG